MSQSDVKELLQNHPNTPFTTRQITNIIDNNDSTICQNLKRFRKRYNNDPRYQWQQGAYGRYIYVYKPTGTQEEEEE